MFIFAEDQCGIAAFSYWYLSIVNAIHGMYIIVNAIARRSFSPFSALSHLSESKPIKEDI